MGEPSARTSSSFKQRTYLEYDFALAFLARGHSIVILQLGQRHKLSLSPMSVLEESRPRILQKASHQSQR